MRAHTLAAVLTAVVAGTAGAQSLPPIHTLGGTQATSVDSLGSMIPSVRALAGGGVLVNDVAHRRLILFDSALRPVKIVADSTPSTANAYGGRFGGLLAYRGDSSLFVDPASMSMLVIDASGKIARVMSVPRSQDAGLLASPSGGAAFDPAGRLVYRGMIMPQMRARSENGVFVPPDFPDSAPVVRVDMSTRKSDTAGYVRIPKVKMNISRNDDGRMTVTNEINPMPVVDDWVLLPDGTIAIVRGEDYHFDFVSPGGTLTKAPRVPYEWHRMTDSDKVAFVDSAKAAIEAARDAAMKQQATGQRQNIGGEGVPGAQVMFFSTGPGGARGSNQPPPLNFISPSELPDYRPAPVPGGTRVDADGNIWVRTSLARPGNGPVYDVIDKTGKLIDRVQVALNKQIVGFGPNGAVYLLEKDGTTYRLQRTTVR